MKTTLKYNTIETFQRQSAWKKFIETIVDNCKGLYDDHLVAEFEDGENVTKDGKSISNIKLSESNDGLVPQIDLSNLLAKYHVLDYLNDGIPLTSRENISLKGLLRTLSLYECEIKNVEMYDFGLPHTYKLKSNEEVITRPVTLDGWNVTITDDQYHIDILNDNEAACSDGEIGCYEFGTGNTLVPAQETVVIPQYDYIKDIYGYSQKHPMLSKADIKEVRQFYEFKKKEDVQDPPSGYSGWFTYVYIDKDNVLVTQSGGTVSFDIVPNAVVYVSVDNRNARIAKQALPTNTPSVYDVEDYYDLNNTSAVKKYCSIDETDALAETSFILLDVEKDELEQKIQNENEFDVYFSLSEGSPLEKITFTNRGVIGEPPYETSIYRDSLYNKEWAIINNITDYYSHIEFLKEQLYSDECTLKAQPLFLYKGDDNKDYISLCANINNITNTYYEFENYKFKTLSDDITKFNNVTNDENYNSDNSIKDVSYGEYFNKWEQNKRGSNTFVNHVYDSSYLGLNYIDGKGNYYWKQAINNLYYTNINRQDYFETMYFNHFIKVYPVTEQTSNSVVSTTRMCSDNLELVMFGDIIPYIVCYDKTETTDLDCAVFSKIIFYDKNTHLIVVDKPINFENPTTPKYVVVAYQNLSPFNKIESIDIVSPKSVKGIVGELLSDFNTFDCKLNLYDGVEYKKKIYFDLIDGLEPIQSKTGIWGMFDETILGNRELRIKFKIVNKSGDTYQGLYSGTAYQEDGTPITTGYNGEVIISKPLTEKGVFQSAILHNDVAVHTSHELSINNYKSVSFYGDVSENGKDAVLDLNLNNIKYQGDIYGLFTDMPNLKGIRNFTLGSVNAYRQMVINCPELVYFGNDGCIIEGSVRCVANTEQRFDLFKGLNNIESIDTSELQYYIQNNTTSIIKVNMTEAFMGCTSLENLKLKFNSNNRIAITNLDRAFEGCAELETLDLSEFDLSQLVSATDMVKDCNKLNTIIVDKDYPQLKNYVNNNIFIVIK